MKGFNRTSERARLLLVSAALCVAASVLPQEAPGPAMHITTQERLATEAWWPTMATAPLQAYVGSGSCIGCHAGQGSSSTTGMQHAATRAGGAHFLPNKLSTAFTSAALTYSLTADKNTLQLSVARGDRKASENVDWVIGAGDLARTFLYEADGRWFQSEASFYTWPSALDITTGFGASMRTSPMAALGNVLSPVEARSCFNCHTVHATTSAGLEPLHAEAGIGCEACHAPGRQHVDSMTVQQSQGGPNASLDRGKSGDVAIFNPGKLSPSDSIDFCGSCHRSFADASLSTGPQADRAVVRFQPYRLEESKCWRATMDERLTCVACHDPHKPLNRDLASYDANCLQCHSGAAKIEGGVHTAAVCPKATHDCVTCHMPKVDLPTMHGSFTDHFIRIAKADGPLPR